MKTVSINTSKNPDMAGVAQGLALDINCGYLDLNKNQSFTQLFRLFRYHQVIIATQSIFNIPLLLILRFARIRTIIGLHDIEPHEEKDLVKFFVYNFLCCRLANDVVCFSDFSREQLLKRKFLPRRKQPILYYFGSRYEPPQPSKQSPRKYDVIFFGRFRPYQGIDNLKYIVEKLHDLEFLIIGRDSISYDFLSFNNVKHIQEYISDPSLFQAIQNSKAVLMCYNTATQSGHIPLAASLEATIVAYDVGALKEQTFELGGIFVAPGEIDKICASLKEVTAGRTARIDYARWEIERRAKNSEAVSLFKKHA